MPSLKLTAAAVERIKLPDSGQVDYFDKMLPGLGLRVSKSGTKSWFVMTRVNGKLLRQTIGRYPAFGLGEAREQAREVLTTAARGVDPRVLVEERRRAEAAKARNTFGALAEAFMEQHVRANLRGNTVREYHRILFGPDTKAWQGRPISSIQKRDVREVIEKIRTRGSPSAASRSLAYLQKFFSWCLDQEVITASPAERLRSTPSTSRDRVLSEPELRLVWQAFDQTGGIFGRLFKLLLLTGQRRSEVAGMRWDELKDLETSEAVWEIPGARTKNKRPHLVPLSSEAVRILVALPCIGPFVFSTTGEKSVSGFSKAKARIDAKIKAMLSAAERPPMPPWSLHDLRRTMVTMMNERLNVAPHIVEAVVNHTTGSAKAGVAGVYNRAIYQDERRRALRAWTDLVCSLASAGGQQNGKAIEQKF